MRLRSLPLFALALMGILCSTHSVRAQEAPDHQRTFAVRLTAGLGDCVGPLCSSEGAGTGPMLGLGVVFLVRPLRYLALGFEAHHNWMSANDSDASRTQEAVSYSLFNVVARGIYPVGALEPWLGLGAGYATWTYGWDRAASEGETRWVNGIDLALSLGADLHLGDRWSVGAMLRVAAPSFNEHCLEQPELVGAEVECHDVGRLDPEDRDELPNHLWYLGLTGGAEF